MTTGRLHDSRAAGAAGRRPDRRTALERATVVFGWASIGLAAAAAACLAWLPFSDPDRKDLEDLVLVPALLGVLSVSAAIVAVTAGLAGLVGNHGRLPVLVAIPWIACALLLVGLGVFVGAPRV